MSAEVLHNHVHAHHPDTDSIDIFGFWLYILTDCVLFGTLFATYLVLNHPGAFGPSLKEHIDLSYVLLETALLLASNFTFGLAILAMNQERAQLMRLWLIITFILGAGFVGLEVNEFIELAHKGYSWQASGGASAFFTLVGTHGTHVSFGLLWIAIMIFQIPVFGVGQTIKRRMTYLGLFWNFLDIVWIFLFSVVYLLGALL